MLYQIAEPGQSEAKAACGKTVVGIDLGTTNSLVASVVDGEPRVIEGEGGGLVPSVVTYREGAVLVGSAAIAHAAASSQHPIRSIKRLMGRTLADLGEAATRWPQELVDDGRVVSVRVPGRAKPLTPVEVSADILRALKSKAEAALGPVDAAVITVPAYFDDAQRQATRDAGRLAGLEVLRLVAEPTAAALAYGLDRGDALRGTFAVYDLGGGTFDISILRLIDGVFEVVATGGDTALGGDDFDAALVAWATANGAVIATEELAAAHQSARAIKERLSLEPLVRWSIGGKQLELTPDVLATAWHPLLERTGKSCRRALRDAELDTAQLDGVILVGGSTKAPVVRAYVETLFGRVALAHLDPERVVAMGAAVQAEVLAGRNDAVTLIDVIPLSLGIETMGGVVEKLIHRNTTIPCGAKQTFTTYADGQTGFDIHIVQGERETVAACRSLGRFVLGGLPPMVAGMARVEISFVVDADGLLQVSAREEVTGKAAEITVKPSYGLTDEEVERMLVESFEHAEEDLAARNLLTERIEAERILAATRAALDAPDGLLDPDVAAAGRRAMVALEATMQGTNHLAIRAGIEALDLATKPFAQARMNRAIEGALRGRRVTEAETLMERS